MTAHLNDTRRPDPRRDACEELAELLATDAGLRTSRLAALTNAGPPSPAAPPDSREPRPISLWQPTTENGELVFVRPAPHPLGDHYARRRAIAARKPPGCRRVAFFGESVAAGYLYAPHLTPAQVLETQLQSVAPFEVVDLARTNETLSHLVATADAARQLDPDVVVIFAGNNWTLLETPELSPWTPSVPARQRYGLALRDGGLRGPIELARRQLARKATDAFARLAALDVPVVVVVPEVNLADWQSRQPVPWLPGDGTPRWWTLHNTALQALAAGRFAEAASAATAMAALDGGTTGTAWRLLARAELGRGRPEAALQAARAEVDHTPYPSLAFLDAPRATSTVRQLLHRAADRHGFGVVDLPRVFAGDEPLPGRRLFLDYCHLSAEGMRLAMAAVASEVLERLDGGRVDASALLQVDLPLTAEADATAKLGAALHGAHRLLTVDGESESQKSRILEHWLRAALAASPGVAEAMLELAEARTFAGPAVLTAAQERNVRSPYRLLLQHGWRWDFLDVELLEAIVQVLDAPRIRDRFAKDLAPGPDGIELARAPFIWEPLERFYPEVMDFADLDTHATLRSPWPRTSFVLPSRGDRGAVLEVVARLPAIAGWDLPRVGRATVRVNGEEVAALELESVWRRQHVRVPARLCRRGWNRVTFEWPAVPPAGDAALEAARRRLEVGLEADLHPIFGEVASLRAASPS